VEENQARVVSTSIPADTILMPGQVGTLAVDVWGDAVIFKLREGEFQLIHAHGEAKIGTQISSTIIAGNRS
jgi:predicted amidohydrolase